MTNRPSARGAGLKRSDATVSCLSVTGAKNKLLNVSTFGEWRGGPLQPLGTVSIEATLDAILQRLDHLEQNGYCQNPHRQQDISSEFDASPEEALQFQSESEPAISIQPDVPFPDMPLAPTSGGHPAPDCQQVSSTFSDSDAPMSVLQHSVDEVQRRVSHHYNSPTVTMDDTDTIEPGSAKSWIQSYFTHSPEDLFPALLNVKLIHLLPDIIGLPNVHLDASIVVVYYCILYHGCFLFRQMTSTSDNARTLSKLYRRCLDAVSAWEPYATGTTTDFTAAFFMMRVAAERFDIDLSWKMFKRGCQYAEKIDLHRLDNDVDLISTSLDKSDLNASRKCFWELVNIDVYFRLIHNKPPSIMACRPDAKVNLPWLAEPGSLADEETTSTIRFLIESRRTFILMEFFQLLEDSNARSDLELISRTEALCYKIEALYEQWEIDDWVTKMMDSDGQLWTIAGMALEGHTCIISMLRRVLCRVPPVSEPQLLDSEVPNHPLIFKASRHILTKVSLLLAAFPCMGTVAVTFVVLQAHVPFACLASSLLRSVAVQDFDNDAVLLERVVEGLKTMSEDIEELAPLTAAMENFNAKIRERGCKHVLE
ncbi:hypothetical protein FSST1_006899 [Fusarium sambucinum]